MTVNSKVTPALNAEAVKIAGEICNKNGTFDRKAFNKAYDTAIKQLGYSPAYFKKCMREIGPEYFD